MSVRGMPIKLLIVGFGALALIALIQISEDARKLLLVGWVLAFYWALSMWDYENRVHIAREEHREDVLPPAQMVRIDEFYDTDRIELQHITGAEIDDHVERV